MLSHQRNANENHSELPLHKYQNDYTQKDKKNATFGRVWKNILDIAGRDIKWYKHFRN